MCGHGIEKWDEKWWSFLAGQIDLGFWRIVVRLGTEDTWLADCSTVPFTTAAALTYTFSST